MGTWTNHAAAAPASCCCTVRRSASWSPRPRRAGLTLVPLALYFKDGKAKVEIGRAKGKKDWDKRQALAEKQAKREMAREFRHRNR